jgi:sugar phosphate isomerase/epimerase
MSKQPLPFLLTGYGVPYSMGYVSLKNGSPNPAPLNISDFLERACHLGLSGIEIPLSALVPSFEGRMVQLDAPSDELAETLQHRKLRLVADYGNVADNDARHLLDYLHTAKRLGASVVRATLSNLLCGDRRPCPGGWPARLEESAARLRQVLPAAEDLDIVIAVENHQDATTEDLLRLADMVGHPTSFGITLDTGNPLAMGEDPCEAARRLSHLIRHVHLKDYTIHFAPDGYRLVRCAAGDGVIDFPAILNIVRGNGHDVAPGIETAAQATRTIRILDPDWWSTYPARDARELLGPFKTLWARGRAANEPYASVWEQGAGGQDVIADEWRTVERSVEYFRALQAAS